MSRFETSLGGDQNAFPETAGSTFLSRTGAGPSDRQAKLNRLCSRYWRPVYAYVRAAWGKSVEDSKDLTQEFFCRLLDEDLVAQYRPQQGRFRHFLKAVLKNFLNKDHRDARRWKRGGGMTLHSLDVHGLEDPLSESDPTRRNPEELFDRQWARDVLTQGIAALRSSLEKEGKETVFAVYRAYDLSTDAEGPPTYEALARSLNLSVHDVTNHLHQARSRLQELLLETVSDYVTSREDLIEEMKELFST